MAALAGCGLVAVALSQFTRVLRPGTPAVIALNAIVLGYLLWQFVLSRLEYVRSRSNAPAPDAGGTTTLASSTAAVVALVPVYNEDPEALRRCLASLFDQSRPLQAICVTDDGSTTSQYPEVRAWAQQRAAGTGVRLHWSRQHNRGKRVAQMSGVDREPQADAYLTVDSDSILDPGALAALIRRFDDPEVYSVAGVVLTTNYRANVLTRMTDLYCVSLQLFERSALSACGAVLVNCGGCALYRGEVVRDNAATYLDETLFGRPVTMSDDSLLTLFAAERGHTVQEPTAFAFTLMPESFSHHRRQQLRWMRGSFIRSGWRLRYLPLRRAAYWLHLARWVQFALVTATAVALALSGALTDPRMWIGVLTASIGVYTLVASRYLTVRRSDQTNRQRWVVFATAPLVSLWSLTVLRVLRWYAMATFAKVGWGTRATVEVTA